MKWFRFYNEFRADPKLSLMTPHHQWAWIILLCLASEDSTRGRIDGLTDEEIAFQVKMPVEDWLTLKAKFKVKNMIEWDEFGISVTHWDERQFESDTSNERVKRHREKKRAKSDKAKTRATLKSQSVTLQERFSNVNVTPPDTDPDTDPDTETENTKERNPLPLSDEKNASLSPTVGGSIPNLNSSLSQDSEPELTTKENWNLEPEPDTELFITVNPVQLAEKTNVPVCDSAAYVPALAKIPPVDTLATQFANKSSSDPNYARFKAIYQGLCSITNANYGVHSKAKLAWQDVSDSGLVGPDFWEGLEQYKRQKLADFAAGNKALGIKGAANWLIDQEWETALARAAFVCQSAERGIDVTSTASIKQSADRAERLANSAAAKQLLIERGIINA